MPSNVTGSATDFFFFFLKNHICFMYLNVNKTIQTSHASTCGFTCGSADVHRPSCAGSTDKMAVYKTGYLKNSFSITVSHSSSQTSHILSALFSLLPIVFIILFMCSNYNYFICVCQLLFMFCSFLLQAQIFYSKVD